MTVLKLHHKSANCWAPDKVLIFISIKPISSQNPMIDNLLESSHRDNSNKWSNMGFGEESMQVVSIEVYFTHLIWSSGIVGIYKASTAD